ncbi:hypothetical protein NDU88_006531 [Pleurodeles waltl]|uniref:Uncharacterized protein n=1 Tax=Pleurodeles waltl TaxID=8319 RepID=A0AAV7MZR7_PLEWA|nr:hypothetical protein NDU88_006531 [Pleurodeles waltl]
MPSVQKFLERRPEGHMALFKHETGECLSTFQFKAVLNGALTRAGLLACECGTHSFQIGVATSAAQHGMSAAGIKAIGRWREVSELHKPFKTKIVVQSADGRRPTPLPQLRPITFLCVLSAEPDLPRVHRFTPAGQGGQREAKDTQEPAAYTHNTQVPKESGYILLSSDEPDDATDSRLLGTSSLTKRLFMYPPAF